VRPETTAPRLFVFGLGYSALALGERLRAQGWSVAGTVRTAEKAAVLRRRGFEVHRFDRDRPLADAAAAIAGTTHLLSSVPPDREGDPVLDRHGADLRALTGGIAWAGYLSTTGVYGDRGGDWVDEESDLRPSGERGARRVAAEVSWRALGLPIHIFRLAGIYGPGRSALDTVRAGRAKRIDKPGQVFSRIHVADIARAVHASMAAPHPGAVYNVCDDAPAAPGDVVAHACRLLGVEPPEPEPFETADLSPMARSFYADSRRVRNDRMKRELGLALLYPDYRAGLAALLRAGA